MAVKQLECMIAVQPDVVLLCVNYCDDEDYILRTINVIENLMETKVLGLVLFPLGYRSVWNRQRDRAEEIPYDKLTEVRERLRSVVGRKVYIAGKEISEICNDIIGYF